MEYVMIWGVLLSYLFTETTLLVLNARYAKTCMLRQSSEDFTDTKTREKTLAYTLAKIVFEIVSNFYNVLLISFCLFSGTFSFLLEKLTSFFGVGYWGNATTLFVVFAFVSLLHLPFEYYRTFKLEERFGFNCSRFQTWIVDQAKTFILAALIAIPVLALFLWFIGSFKRSWWLWTSASITLFQIVFLLLYPKLILPLFNRLKPLDEGALKDRLNALATKAGFKNTCIQVIDGSRRSKHSNAYFSGVGKVQRIVLYDTLIQQASEPELEAILAHEIGHYKHKHLSKQLVFSFVITTIGLKFLDLFLSLPGFAQLLGFGQSALSGILILGILLPFITYWLNPLQNIFSRYHEYQADAFAVKLLQDSINLKNALRKLYTENLSNLFPHPLYSFFHYSHPTFLEREEAICNQLKHTL